MPHVRMYTTVLAGIPPTDAQASCVRCTLLFFRWNRHSAHCRASLLFFFVPLRLSTTAVTLSCAGSEGASQPWPRTDALHVVKRFRPGQTVAKTLRLTHGSLCFIVQTCITLSSGLACACLMTETKKTKAATVLMHHWRRRQLPFVAVRLSSGKAHTRVRCDSRCHRRKAAGGGRCGD